MIKKDLRLGRVEVLSVIKQGFFVKKTCFNARILKKDQLKVAFVASKKYFKTSVLRNKAKRKIKASFLASFDKKTLFYIVFFIKPPIFNNNLDFLRSEIRSLEQINLK